MKPSPFDVRPQSIAVKTKYPFWGMLYLLWNETKTGVVRSLVIFVRWAYVQPYHSEGLGESFPLMWLNFGLCWKITELYTTLVSVPHQKQAIVSPKRVLCFYCDTDLHILLLFQWKPSSNMNEWGINYMQNSFEVGLRILMVNKLYTPIFGMFLLLTLRLLLL